MAENENMSSKQLEDSDEPSVTSSPVNTDADAVETSAQSRHDLLDTAVKFLKNAKIAPSPLATKKAFLKSKGLSEDQINQACQMAGISANDSPNSQIIEEQPRDGHIYPVLSAYPQTSWLVTLRDFANVIFLFGSATYGMHFLWKHYIRPWLMNQKSEGDKFKDTVQNSLETISSTMVTLEATLSTQKIILEQLLQKSSAMEMNNNWRQEGQDIRSEIISLKGLLLSSSKFASPPVVSGLNIPEWQMVKPEPIEEKLVMPNFDGIKGGPDLVMNNSAIEPETETPPSSEID